MYTSAGTPPGETGNTTIRFESLSAGVSVADTTPANWSAPQVLKAYLGGSFTVYGWSGSEQLHLNGGDYLAGFTAWGPTYQGISITRMTWNGSDFTLGAPSLTSVDEYRSAARGLRMTLAGYAPHADAVAFEIESPLALEARLDVFDTQGRHVVTLLNGPLAAGRATLRWDVATADGGVASGVYFARLSFPGGVRTAMIPIAR
jgi:hypothetical protein